MAPEFIPQRPKDAKYRTLIVLLGGTGTSTNDNNATHIALLDEMLYNGKESGEIIMSSWSTTVYAKVLYALKAGSPPPNQEGIGAICGKLLRRRSGCVEHSENKFDKAVATSFKTHIIAENYQDNNKICIFGFSRGAYSARALAGMLNAMGLLRVSDTTSAKEAYDLYEEYNEGDEDKAWLDLLSKWKVFRTKHNVKKPFVEFLGCWDSVNSVGMMDNIKLAYTATNGIVRTFRHAVALDERRAKFKQNMWSQPAVAANAQPNGDNGPSVVTDVQEVWFAGCHVVHVGGGSVLNGTRPNLAHIPLRWMIRECFKARTGVLSPPPSSRKLGIEPSSLYPDVRARPVAKAVTRAVKPIKVIEAPGWVPWAKSFLPTGSTHTPKKVQKLTLPNMSEEELDARDALHHCTTSWSSSPRRGSDGVVLLHQKVSTFKTSGTAQQRWALDPTRGEYTWG
ncbi:hypothetical protein B0H13DRAFT_2342495 [Mycena leptocephala]|nr:hypothetical protein B0H13DRAFT_2342495 [Mycena leptocephala]